jgi:hypothetical protein
MAKLASLLQERHRATQRLHNCELESLEFLPVAPAIASDEDDDSSEGSSIEHEYDSTAESTDKEAP